MSLPSLGRSAIADVKSASPKRQSIEAVAELSFTKPEELSASINGG